ncbi:pyocin knob domain-containing protein [Citrobacter freundii]|uniref:pyocin knob domain-containing protein n=1 Tax=Citrobacter freundii TaxID=546 RepID=UPI002B2430FC|nr:pyocin knob domain-containing protein [Citrobacter freundii]MEB2478210.1 pyocin knob domain-containing protein [Citrobacter freundii]
MAGNINEIGIFTQASNLPLLADLQYLEPYSSGGLNRKMLGIILPGIFRGFNVTPGTGLNIVISSTADGTGAACIEVNGYQVTVTQVSDVTLAIPKGQTTIVLLEANYGPTLITKQVSSGATTDAARFVTVAQGQSIKSNQIEICRITLSSNATSITADNIKDTRTRRRVGPIISDAIDSTEKYQVASSNAIRLALAAAKAESDKKVAKGELGIAADNVPIDTAFDWQTHNFKGGEYVYFSWAQSLNKPPMNYPDGDYQITVTGLSVAGFASLLIRPINYLQPIAPFLISWTGAPGSRVFKFRAMITSLPDLSQLPGIGPNNLIQPYHVGIYAQPADAGADVNLGYPVAEAGTLSVTPSAWSIQQEYVTYSTNRRFVRGMGASGTLQSWKETPNLNNDALWQGGKKLGLNAVEQNSVYFENATGTIVPMNTIVGGVRTNWYTHNSFAGLRRNGSDGIAGYSVELDGIECFRIIPNGDVIAPTGRIKSQGYLSGFCWYDNKTGTERASFNVDTSSANVLELWANDAGGSSHWQFTGNSIYNPNTISGASNSALAGLRCVPEGGNWDKWRDRASALQVDVSNDSSAVNVWKATQWGVDHLAAMQVAAFASNNSAQVQLNVKAKTFNFDSVDGFNAFKVTTDWLHVNANGGKLTIGDNDSGLYPKADGAVSFTTDGVERGFYNNSRLHYGTISASNFQIGDLNKPSQMFNLGNETTSRSSMLLRLWGNGTDRANVLELGDDTGYLFYAQRNSDNSIELNVNGKVSVGSIASSGPVQAQYFRNVDGQLLGSGGFAGQLDALAPFYMNAGLRRAEDNTYFPLVKGRMQLTTGYPTAVSFGFVTGGGTFPNACIQIKGDNTEKLWTFGAVDGGFSSPGAIWSAGGITASGDLRAGGNVTWGGSGASTAANGDIYGDVYGQIAGGGGNRSWVSEAIARCWQKAVDGVNTGLGRVSDIYLGALIGRQFWSGNAGALGNGDNAVMVSITFVGGGSNEGWGYFRKLMYNVNGSIIEMRIG